MENNLSLIRTENNYLVHFRVALRNYERLVMEERMRRRGHRLRAVKNKEG